MILSEIETLDRLRNTRLRGHGQPFIYRHADLQLVQGVDTSTLVPPQRYVLSGTVDAIREIANSFEDLGVDVFALNGALLFWTDDMDPWGLPIPFLPPIVEESFERDEKCVLLVNDGMHRVYTARMSDRNPNVIVVKGVSKEYPYYAYGIQDGWDVIQELAELPNIFQKKDYRDPNSYKALFRDFNAVFPGIQAQRKQSNPSHIKE